MASNWTIPIVAGGVAIVGYELLNDRDASELDRGDDTTPPTTSPPTSSPRPPNGGPGPLVWPTVGRWIVPVPTWHGRAAVVSDGWGTRRGGRFHRGADLMYARTSADRFAAGSPNGDRNFVMPDGVCALAASDGAVWSGERTARGWAVVVSHGHEWATFYTHLDALIVAPTQRAKSGQIVKAGDPIGIVGADPMDAEHLMHLHFELWHGGPGDAVDPTPYLQLWQSVPAPATPPTVAMRNLSPYRAVGDGPHERYPDWLRDLDGASGVAAIRSKKTGEVLYVGESERGNLYKNLTRHLQEWRRVAGYPKGNPKEGHDPGVTYNRDAVEIAFEKLPGKQALGRKKKLVAQLEPRDNVHYRPRDDR